MLGKDKYIRKVTYIGFFLNLVLCTFKFVIGTIGSSQALIADGIHSLSDSITDVAIIIASYFWSKPPDKNHHYGHYRIETFVTILIGIILITVSFYIIYDAVLSIYKKDFIKPSFAVVVVAIISIIFKETLYRYNVFIGEKIKSPALIANAWHHRSDAISSVAVTITIGISLIFPKLIFLDKIGAIIVAVLILQAAFSIIIPRFKEIMDIAVPVKTCEEIKNIIFENKKVKDVHKLRTRYISMNFQVDVHIVVDGNMSVNEGYKVAEDVKKRIKKKMPNVLDVIIYVEPS